MWGVTQPQGCCPTAPAPSVGHRAAWHPPAIPTGCPSLAHRQAGPCLAEPQGWGKRGATLPEYNPHPGKQSPREGAEKKPHGNKTLLAAAESSDSRRRQPP